MDSFDPPVEVDPRVEKPSGCLRKLFLLLAAGSLIAAAVLVFGFKLLTTTLATLGGFSKDPQKIHRWLDAAHLGDLSLPPGYGYAGAYRLSGARAFVVRPEGVVTPLSKESALALDFRTQGQPTYYLLTLTGKHDNIDADLGALLQKVQTDARITAQQDRIWVEEKERPAIVGEAAGGSRPYHVFLLRFPEGLLLGTTPNDAMAVAPDRQMVAAVLREKPENISFTEPVPPSLQLARIIVTGETSARKTAVTQLALLDGAHPEAVSFLAAALTTSSSDVKTDIIAGVGLLARKNPEAIPVLGDALNDKSIRLEAMAALGSLGAAAGAEIPALEKISKNRKEPKGIRAAAQQALMRIEGRPLIAPPKKKGATRAKKTKSRGT